MRFDENKLTVGPANPETGLALWVEWEGERFDTPSFEEIREWVYDSVCETLDGQTIEPDGVAYNGCPSWLLALALV